MLRIDVDVDEPPYYAVPPGNPFAAPRGVALEIWATGLRNPWRFSFDRATGDLYIGDVGQGEFEEIDIVALGGNLRLAGLRGHRLHRPRPGPVHVRRLRRAGRANIGTPTVAAR